MAPGTVMAQAALVVAAGMGSGLAGCVAGSRIGATRRTAQPAGLSMRSRAPLLRELTLSCSLSDWVDLVGDEPMGFAVHGRCGVGVGSVDQAEDLAVLLVDPVAQVVNAVCILGLHVGGVCLCHVVDGDRAADGVRIHEQCHGLSFPEMLCGLAARNHRKSLPARAAHRACSLSWRDDP